jgi:hypothetical protein
VIWLILAAALGESSQKSSTTEPLMNECRNTGRNAWVY